MLFSNPKGKKTKKGITVCKSKAISPAKSGTIVNEKCFVSLEVIALNAQQS